MPSCLFTGVHHLTVGLFRVIITTKTLCFSFMLTSSRTDSIRASQLSPDLIVLKYYLAGYNLSKLIPDCFKISGL